MEKYIKTMGKPTKEATLCLLMINGKILLAMKKRGFGMGKYNGPGGKKKDGESISEAAVRETKEEIGIEIKNMEMVGVIEFYFAKKPEWNQKVTIFKISKWNGEPIESEEMRPEWFEVDKIPFEKMWADDKYWLPKVIQGKKVKARFLFDEQGEVLENQLLVVNSL